MARREDKDGRAARHYDAVVSRIDRHMGIGSSALVLKMLNLAYRIGEEEARSNPAMLEEKLGRLLGDRTAELILRDVKMHQPRAG